MEKKVLTEKEIEKKISDIKAIWGIEGMEVMPEDELSIRKYLAGEISKEELMAEVIEK